MLSLFLLFCTIFWIFFLWSYLWFIILSSVVFNLLPDTSIGILTCYYIFYFRSSIWSSSRSVVMFYSLSYLWTCLSHFSCGKNIYKLNKSISEICPGLILLSIVYTGSHSCCLISLCVYLSFNCLAGCALKTFCDSLRLEISVLSSFWPSFQRALQVGDHIKPNSLPILCCTFLGCVHEVEPVAACSQIIFSTFLFLLCSHKYKVTSLSLWELGRSRRDKSFPSPQSELCSGTLLQCREKCQ